MPAWCAAAPAVEPVVKGPNPARSAGPTLRSTSRISIPSVRSALPGFRTMPLSVIPAERKSRRQPMSGLRGNDPVPPAKRSRRCTIAGSAKRRCRFSSAISVPASGWTTATSRRWHVRHRRNRCHRNWPVRPERPHRSHCPKRASASIAAARSAKTGCCERTLAAQAASSSICAPHTGSGSTGESWPACSAGTVRVVSKPP